MATDLKVVGRALLDKAVDSDNVERETFKFNDFFTALYADRPREGRIGRIERDVTAVVTCYEGTPGREYTLSLALAYPEGSGREPLGLRQQPFVRQATFSQTLVLSLKLRFDHVESGTYYIRVLVDLEPLVEFAMPVFWSDES